MRRLRACLDPRPEHWPVLEERRRTYCCLSQPIAALFAAQYPQDAEAMAAAFYQRRPTAIRVNSLRTTDGALTQTLQQEGHTVTAGPWPHCLLVMFNGNPAASKAFHAGQFHVQGLASQFAALCCDARPGMRVLDLCAGSGCIGLAVASQAPQARVVLGEYSDAALKVCRQNIRRNGLTGRVVPMQADAREKPERALGEFQCIVSNPPYIPHDDIAGLDTSVKDYEPHLALDGGEDGLDFYQTISGKWKDALVPGGRLYFEVGIGQADSVLRIMRAQGFGDIQVVKDLHGIPRVVFGTLCTEI